MLNFEDFAQGEPEMLLEAALGMTKNLDIQQVLQELVDQACQLIGAPNGGLLVVDAWGETLMFIPYGYAANETGTTTLPPVLRDLIGSIPPANALILNDMASDPYYRHVSADLIQIENFLGAPVRVKDQFFGRLYLTDKPGGFTDNDVQLLRFLASAAGIAVENARLYRESINGKEWMSATQTITAALLEGTEEEEALALIAKTVRKVSDSDTVIIVLPSVGDVWMCEIADGYLSQELIGSIFPPNGRAQAVLREGAGMIVDSFARAFNVRIPILREFGSALYAPLMAGKVANGVLVLLRKPTRMEFDPADLPLAEGLATQVAFALELAEARHAEDVNTLLDERERIGRDLHDFVIQQLFATGMQIDTVQRKLSGGEISPEEIKVALDDALNAVDASVRQIRSIVHNLRERDRDVTLIERVRRETSLARTALGFAPSLIIEVDGQVIGDEDDEYIREVCERLDPDIAEDITAVIREALSNVARHAKANGAHVTLSGTPGSDKPIATVIVEDDGLGIPKNRKRNSGLGNLETRARRHGGTVTLERGRDGVGTCLTWQVPLV